MNKDYFALILRLLLGAVFLYASWDKILHPKAFAQAIYNYQILPDKLINFAAIVLPWLELFLGFCVIFGIWLPGTVFFINALLFTFFAALIFNLSRGLNVDCGCFNVSSSSGENNSTTLYIVRDAIFLISAVILFVKTCFKKQQISN